MYWPSDVDWRTVGDDLPAREGAWGDTKELEDSGKSARAVVAAANLIRRSVEVQKK